MRRPKMNLRRSSYFNALALAAAMLFILLASGGCVSRPAHAQSGEKHTVILMEDGTVICTDADEAESIAADLNRDSPDYLNYVIGGYDPSYVKSRYVSAVVSVERCPEGSIIPLYDYW